MFISLLVEQTALVSDPKPIICFVGRCLSNPEITFILLTYVSSTTFRNICADRSSGTKELIADGSSLRCSRQRFHEFIYCLHQLERPLRDRQIFVIQCFTHRTLTPNR